MVPMAALGLASIMGVGALELVVLLLIGMLLFGRRLPEVGHNMGKTITEFKKGMSDAMRDIPTEVPEDPKPRALPRPKPAAEGSTKRLPVARRHLPDVADEP